MNFLLAGLMGLASICAQDTQTFHQKLFDVQNRLALQNAGGLANGGVCWWHSRFQRAAWALAVFDPTQPKPDANQARAIIRSLIQRNTVVVIPGYDDLQLFTGDYRHLIQTELEQWQIRDGFLNQAWIRGISGRSSLSARALKSQMDKIYSRFTDATADQDVLWLLLQIKGIVSHASLLVGMTPTANGGYHLEMVDSNVPQGIVTYEYQNGDTSLTPDSPLGYENSFSMVPYLGYDQDLTRIHRALRNYCHSFAR